MTRADRAHNGDDSQMVTNVKLGPVDALNTQINAINVKKEAKQLVVEECLLPIKKNFHCPSAMGNY